MLPPQLGCAPFHPRSALEHGLYALKSNRWQPGANFVLYLCLVSQDEEQAVVHMIPAGTLRSVLHSYSLYQT